MNPVSVVAPSQSPPTQGFQSAIPLQQPSYGAFADTSENETNGAAVIVNLSQDAKDILARANENQTAANRILAFVDASRSGGSHQSDSPNDSWSNNEPSLEQEYQQLTGNSSPTLGNPQASQDGTVTITLSEYSEA
jgi:hypothetical protein